MITSAPAAFATATPSTLETPLSTVTISAGSWAKTTRANSGEKP